ncbi:MAG: transaldolase, partial [candidate division Zixibacteria bacterium]|nr:transaldolase [candidate division Zixibacteria bacterium]
EAEPSGKVTAYGPDRMFVFLRMSKESPKGQQDLRRELLMLRAPAVDITIDSFASLGGQFLLWEAATAAAGWLMEINPFDEPNVTESKENTKSILETYSRSKRFPLAKGKTSRDLTLLSLTGKASGDPLEQSLTDLFANAKPPRYVAILNYFKSDKRTELMLARIRELIRDRTRCATLRGYGPRFLHSIGQLYKGGAPDGMFLVLTRADHGRLPIPNQPFGFGELITAQAIGDSRALIKRKLPTVVIELDGSPSAGLEQVYRIVDSILSK